uniref:Uncharacterized protein n=1 Tax=Triticum urartu TaxID=4572 RepID=A0A8R7U201_TRIUA
MIRASGVFWRDEPVWARTRACMRCTRLAREAKIKEPGWRRAPSRTSFDPRRRPRFGVASVPPLP